MVKSQHLVLGTLFIIAGLLSAMVTMFAMSPATYNNVESAQAQGMNGSEIIAVPVSIQGQQGEFLAVIARTDEAMALDGSGYESGTTLAIYSTSDSQGRNGANLRLLSVRRIDPDFRLRYLNLHEEDTPRGRQMESRTGLAPIEVHEYAESNAEGEPGDD